MQRKPGQTLQEQAARIRQGAATCDFPSIQDAQDEALRQRFICSVNNEAVLKALFKVKDTELIFTCAVEVAIETEVAARVAKETVYGSKVRPVNKVHQNKKKGPQRNHQQSHSKDQQKCYRYGKAHKGTDCPYKEAVSFLWPKGTFESCLLEEATSRTGTFFPQPFEEDHKSWKQSSVKFLKTLLGWMCPSQSRTVSSPWNWSLPLREILSLPVWK